MPTVQRIPVIDLQDFPAQSPELINACQEWGCFRIINHHTILPQSLMSEMKAVVRSLLDLPAEIKSRNVDVIAGSGYVGPTQINPLYEALGLYDMASTKAVELFCSQLNASPHQRDTIVRYAAAVHKIFMDIGSKLAEGLGLKGVSFEDWPCQFRINKYNFTPESVGSSGVQIHTDSGFLTILQDDEGVGGLEVMNKSEEFIAVDPWPGTLLVNLGDIATAWSNGRFCNVKHRVQCKEATVRVSIASFLLGPKKEVEPPPELVDTDQPRLYVPFTYEEFRKMRIMNKMHAGEALALEIMIPIVAHIDALKIKAARLSHEAAESKKEATKSAKEVEKLKKEANKCAGEMEGLKKDFERLGKEVEAIRAENKAHMKELEVAEGDFKFNATKTLLETRIQMIEEYKNGQATTWNLEDERKVLEDHIGEPADAEEVNSAALEALVDDTNKVLSTIVVAQNDQGENATPAAAGQV